MKPARLARRAFLGALPALAVARSVFAAAGAKDARLGLAAFSCHQHWKAVRTKEPDVKFADARSFYDYARTLGGDGVQTSVRENDTAFAESLRAHVEKTGGYFEGDLTLPQVDGKLATFEREVVLTRAAGATVARSTFTGARRYEGFKSLAEFREFQRKAEARLAAALPILEKHRLKLALENHKDHTAAELAALLRKFSSEWIGALVDTGNNLALLEEPQTTVELLAPFAFSVHLKDMAVLPADDGFLLSEVAFGDGFLDLARLVATLRGANPGIVFNLEMATRDPLRVPCRTDAYWAVFEKRDEAALTAALARVKANPPKQPPPRVSGLDTAAVLAAEEENNRRCLAARASLGL
ncbi:MAG: TIM barrel protein [Verrucomicrobia bacterium]|nr:TIM barrel protein [Verrucomicrobiota bacterium]